MPNKTMYILTCRSSNHTSRNFPRRCNFNNVEVCMIVINCIIVSAWVILETIWLLILRRVVNKDWHIQTMGYYAAVKMNEEDPHELNWFGWFPGHAGKFKKQVQRYIYSTLPSCEKEGEYEAISAHLCKRYRHDKWETRETTDLGEWKGVKGKGMIMD